MHVPITPLCVRGHVYIVRKTRCIQPRKSDWRLPLIHLSNVYRTASVGRTDSDAVIRMRQLQLLRLLNHSTNDNAMRIRARGLRQHPSTFDMTQRHHHRKRQPERMWISMRCRGQVAGKEPNGWACWRRLKAQLPRKLVAEVETTRCAGCCAPRR